ncbi:hypothetical protein EVAR_47479_1 [Eumeta japonica]|uniref:Uncharacterized protein n=1 Tax=Eumeta variegata TaxID=151549 RepID=A0A4C1XA94_EUMVA|nr:hypothetical protein EVAR_47479_1 [Eumeta japonica]
MNIRSMVPAIRYLLTITDTAGNCRHRQTVPAYNNLEHFNSCVLIKGIRTTNKVVFFNRQLEGWSDCLCNLGSANSARVRQQTSAGPRHKFGRSRNCERAPARRRRRRCRTYSPAPSSADPT